MLSFVNKLETEQILRIYFDLMEMTFFGQTSDMGQIIQKTVLLIKMSHIQLNLLF